jgi:hypothetical protein
MTFARVRCRPSVNLKERVMISPEIAIERIQEEIKVIKGSIECEILLAKEELAALEKDSPEFFKIKMYLGANKRFIGCLNAIYNKTIIAD